MPRSLSPDVSASCVGTCYVTTAPIEYILQPHSHPDSFPRACHSGSGGIPLASVENANKGIVSNLYLLQAYLCLLSDNFQSQCKSSILVLVHVFLSSLISSLLHYDVRESILLRRKKKNKKEKKGKRREGSEEKEERKVLQSKFKSSITSNLL